HRVPPYLPPFPTRRSSDLGIALFLFGTGLAFFLGKPYIQPSAPRLPHLALGWWSSSPQIRVALEINALFVAGIVLALALRFILRSEEHTSELQSRFDIVCR